MLYLRILLSLLYRKDPKETCCSHWEGGRVATARQSMKFDALCEFVEEELMDLKRCVAQALTCDVCCFLFKAKT